MKLKKIFVVLTAVLFIVAESLGACTIFAVGKYASADGSTMISHLCDSNSDDPRLWLIPSMPAGTERDVVLNGRRGADYSQFPEVKDYGPNSMVLGSEVYDKPTYPYLHSQYSFMNAKGVAMGECTNGYDRGTEQGKKLKNVWNQYEGVMDLYCLQDMALENCATAREAVEYMGKMIEKYGWNGMAETVNICDGDETWILEAYGGPVWCAVRVPDDMVFVAANRSRIREIDFNDAQHANYYWYSDIKKFALDNDLWDGKSDFSPCGIFSPNHGIGSTLREWRCMNLLDPSLKLEPPTKTDPDQYPMFVKPAKHVSVADIHRFCSDYYQGTEFDCSRTVESGPFGNPLSNRNVYRPVNMFRCTYIQIANVKGWLPDEAKCLTWFGWGAGDTTYLTPVFASVKSLPEHFGIGKRHEPYSTDSGFWVAAGVQQTATINYEVGSKVIKDFRDPKMEKIYAQTAMAQDLMAGMIKAGMKDEAIDFLTNYVSFVSNDWHDSWIELDALLRSKLMFGNVDMRVPKAPQWWTDIVNENLGDKLRPLPSN